jgi:tRNA threonylcarbamoyladenosine biosynthesis protein TsaE
MSRFISNRYEDTVEYGKSIGLSSTGGEMIILSGQLGSGKTVLTKGIADGLGIDEVVTSPSFAIMNLYNGRLVLCHFDFYRIENRVEMEDLLEDFLYRNGYVCVVEWGDPLIDILESYLHIQIDINEEARVITEEHRHNDVRVDKERGGAV